MEPESRCVWLGVAKWYFVFSLYKALSSTASIKTNSNYQFSGERMFVFSPLYAMQGLLKQVKNKMEVCLVIEKIHSLELASQQASRFVVCCLVWWAMGAGIHILQLLVLAFTKFLDTQICCLVAKTMGFWIVWMNRPVT